MALVFPTPAQAAAQTPLNTFSPTSSPLFNTSNNFTYVYNTTLGAWVANGSGVYVPDAATPAQAAAGTLNTLFSSPETAVPKDAAGMTGAAILPGGTTADRPGVPGTGWLRHNSSLVRDPTRPLNFLEYYDFESGSWQQLTTWAQANQIQIDTYSQTIKGYIYPDTPLEPAFNTGVEITVPAGYTEFVVTSYMSWQFDYDTTLGGLSCQQKLLEVTTDTEVGYNAVGVGNLSNVQGLKINSTATGNFVGLVENSYTFRQQANKDALQGPISNADFGMSVLAWQAI